MSDKKDNGKGENNLDDIFKDDPTQPTGTDFLEDELGILSLEDALIERGFKKAKDFKEVGNFYENPNIHYTIKVSSEENKAKVIFGYEITEKTNFVKLNDSVRGKIRSVEGLRSMPPLIKGVNYSVGFYIKYESIDEVFQRAEEVSESVRRVIADNLKRPLANISYIEPSLARTIQINYAREKK